MEIMLIPRTTREVYFLTGLIPQQNKQANKKLYYVAAFLVHSFLSTIIFPFLRCVFFVFVFHLAKAKNSAL